MKKSNKFSKIQVLRDSKKGMIEIDVNGIFEEEHGELIVYFHGSNSIAAHRAFDELYDVETETSPEIQINFLDGDEGYICNNVRVIGGNVVGNVYVNFSK